MSIFSTASPRDLPASLKPFAITIPQLATLFGVGLTKAWELVSDDGPIETIKLDGRTLAVYESAEHHFEERRRAAQTGGVEAKTSRIAKATATSVVARQARKSPDNPKGLRPETLAACKQKARIERRRSTSEPCRVVSASTHT
jgi:hypothetical protein